MNQCGKNKQVFSSLVQTEHVLFTIHDVPTKAFLYKKDWKRVCWCKFHVQVHHVKSPLYSKMADHAKMKKNKKEEFAKSQLEKHGWCEGR